MTLPTMITDEQANRADVQPVSAYPPRPANPDAVDVLAGTLNSRPAIAEEGSQYYATDVDSLYVYVIEGG